MTDEKKTGGARRAKLALWILIPLLLLAGLVFGWHNRASRASLELDLLGYNYTDQHIEDYGVHGLSGGIVRVSSLTSGGSGSVCCIALPDTRKQPVFVRVRWQVGGCTYIFRDPVSSKSGSLNHYYYKEAYVEVPPYTGKPRHLETHFFPDGTVKVRLTEDMSFPELRLDESRLREIPFPRCKNDEEPE